MSCTDWRTGCAVGVDDSGFISGAMSFAHTIGNGMSDYTRDNPGAALLIAIPLTYVFYNAVASRACNAFVKPRRDAVTRQLNERQAAFNATAQATQTRPVPVRLNFDERLVHAVPNNLVLAGALCASLLAATTVTDLAVYQRFQSPESLGTAAYESRTLGYINGKTRQGLNWLERAAYSLL